MKITFIVLFVSNVMADSQWTVSDGLWSQYVAPICGGNSRLAEWPIVLVEPSCRGAGKLPGCCLQNYCVDPEDVSCVTEICEVDDGVCYCDPFCGILDDCCCDVPEEIPCLG